MYNIVSGLSTILEIKKSKHFKLTLGLSTTKIDRSGERVLNDDDKFSFFYNQKYQNPVYMQGKIGNINFDFSITKSHLFPISIVFSNEGSNPKNFSFISS